MQRQREQKLKKKKYNLKPTTTSTPHQQRSFRIKCNFDDSERFMTRSWHVGGQKSSYEIAKDIDVDKFGKPLILNTSYPNIVYN